MEWAEITSCDTCNGTLTFEPVGTLPEVALSTPAWCVLDTSQLWRIEMRGEDRVIPGVVGVRPYRRIPTLTTMEFPMVVVGRRDRFGALQADPIAGLTANLQFLRENLESPVPTIDGTRPLRWDRADGVVMRANVHVVPPLEHAIGPGATCRMVLRISVPQPFSV